jgi:hypothetical protein
MHAHGSCFRQRKVFADAASSTSSGSAGFGGYTKKAWLATVSPYKTTTIYPMAISVWTAKGRCDLLSAGLYSVMTEQERRKWL